MQVIPGKKRLTRLSVLIVVAAIVCPVCSVADANAPSWRGTAGSTYQEWTFATSANPASPEFASNPYGVPSAVVNCEPLFGKGWKDTLTGVYGSAQGWWDIARGSIALDIVNRPDTGVSTSRDIQVQVIYWVDINQAPSVVVSPSATLVSKTTTKVETGPVGGGWYLDLWTLHVEPTQENAIITITGHPSMGSQIDRVVVDTRYIVSAVSVASAAEARKLQAETACELSGPVVTRSFDSFFYMEDRSRAAGIRVNCADGQSPAEEGTAPKVKGIVRTVDGERVIDEATVEPGGTGSIAPLGMPNRAVVSGLSPQGLLVRLWGRAQVSSPEAAEFALDDGSGHPVRVELHGTAAPSDGAYVAIIGVLGADANGPILRAGSNDSAVQLN